jgi:DNA-binding IclR family transcriptional regulator
LIITLGSAAIAVKFWNFFDGGAVTVYERWETDGPRAISARAPAHDRKFVIALARGLDVLRAFTPTDCLLGNQELAQRTRLPKATISRLTYTLTKLGYLLHNERLSKYTLAPAAISIGYAALINLHIRQVALPLMQELADQSDTSVALGIRDRLNLVYIEQARGHASSMLRLELGARLPIATTAMGRALLAAAPEEEREWLMGHIAKDAGDNWPSLREGIEQAVSDYEKYGFTLSIGEWQSGIAAAGVPFVPADGSGVYAFNCAKPAFQLSRERLVSDIGPRLAAMVRKLQAALNGH